MEPYLNFHRIPFIFKRIYFPIILYNYITDWILDYLEKNSLWMVKVMITVMGTAD